MEAFISCAALATSSNARAAAAAPLATNRKRIACSATCGNLSAVPGQLGSYFSLSHIGGCFDVAETLVVSDVAGVIGQRVSHHQIDLDMVWRLVNVLCSGASVEVASAISVGMGSSFPHSCIYNRSINLLHQLTGTKEFLRFLHLPNHLRQTARVDLEIHTPLAGLVLLASSASRSRPVDR